MFSKWMWAVCVVVMGAVLVTGAAWAAEETKAPAAKAAATTTAAEPVKLNKAAENAIKAEFPKAVIGEVEKEGEVFSAKFTVETAAMEIDVTTDGMIVEIESVIAEKDLPAAVAKAVAAAAEGAKVTKAEKSEVRAESSKKDGEAAKFTKLEKAKLYFEVTLTTKDGKEAEMKVAEDGTVVEALKVEEKKVETKTAAPTTAAVTATVAAPTMTVAPTATHAAPTATVAPTATTTHTAVTATVAAPTASAVPAKSTK